MFEAQNFTVPVGGTTWVILVNTFDSANNSGGGANVGKDLTTSNINNWSIDLTNNTTATANSAFLKFSDGTQSGVRIKWVDNTLANSIIAGYVDNGSSYASSETFPDFIQINARVSPYSTTSDTRIVISGLPDNTSNGYKLTVLCTRSTATSRPVTFAVGATTGTPTPSPGTAGAVEAQNNTANEVIIDNLTPTSNTLTITVTHTNGFSFLNSIKIEHK
jgi:hypothetical protein